MNTKYETLKQWIVPIALGIMLVIVTTIVYIAVFLEENNLPFQNRIGGVIIMLVVFSIPLIIAVRRSVKKEWTDE